MSYGRGDRPSANGGEARKPPPPAEAAWSDEKSEVEHLNDASFKKWLATTKHVLVMFYAPWCGHCKRAKPEYTAAANALKSDPDRKFAAVDCTISDSLCEEMGVSGYPTFNYFYKGASKKGYNGGRTKDEFINYLKKAPVPKTEL